MKAAKSIDTLIEDIHDIFTKDHEIDEENLKELGQGMMDVVRQSIVDASSDYTPMLRMSIIGKPNRLLWYELKGNTKPKKLPPEKYIMFLFGHIIEQLIIFLIREAGHTVGHLQEELEIDGVVGHCDLTVDGVPVDIKSASKYSFANKFKNRGLLAPYGDPFGYIGQLSAYREKLLEKYPDEVNADTVAWIAFNKETADMHVLTADSMELMNAESRIKEIRSVLSKDSPPDVKCYPDVPKGKSGNRVLNRMCSWCSFKDTCWSDANGGEGLRRFQYSNEIVEFTQLEKLPSVEEVS